MPTPSLLQRLKERSLVQRGLGSLAGAFVVFQSVERVVEGNWPSVLAMAVSPLWDPYRANPRFQDLMEAYAGKDPSE